MNVLLMRIGRIVIAVGQPSPSSSYATGELKAIEKIPEGYRPASYGSILFASNNGGAVGSWYISSDGSITIRGKADKGYYQTCTGCWLTFLNSPAPPDLYTGSGVYKDAGSGGYATLWTFGQFKTQFGRDWNNDVVVAAINGDWDANGRQVTSVRVSQSGNRIDVMFDGKNTAPIRVNWAVMWRG